MPKLQKWAKKGPKKGLGPLGDKDPTGFKNNPRAQSECTQAWGTTCQGAKNRAHRVGETR
jgi:hypothetical protein